MNFILNWRKKRVREYSRMAKTAAALNLGREEAGQKATQIATDVIRALQNPAGGVPVEVLMQHAGFLASEDEGGALTKGGHGNLMRVAPRVAELTGVDLRELSPGYMQRLALSAQVFQLQQAGEQIPPELALQFAQVNLQGAAREAGLTDI